MKISDLLSPADVMIDVRTSNKGLLLQEFAAKAAASLGLPGRALPSQEGRAGLDGDRPWRSHSACATARFAGAFRAACETEAADRIRRHRWAAGGHRIYTLVAGGGGERTTRAARAGGPEIESAGESGSIAWRKDCVRALFGDALTAGINGNARPLPLWPMGRASAFPGCFLAEPSLPAKIIFP